MSARDALPGIELQRISFGVNPKPDGIALYLVTHIAMDVEIFSYFLVLFVELKSFGDFYGTISV
jgi:hypothetical protein